MSKGSRVSKVTARKKYKCDICNNSIQVGDKYFRHNMNYYKIFHACNKHSKEQVKDFILKKVNSIEFEYKDDYDFQIGEKLF